MQPQQLVGICDRAQQSQCCAYALILLRMNKIYCHAVPRCAGPACGGRGAASGGSLEYCPPDERIPPTWWLGGLGACAVFCTAVLSPLMSLPAYEPAAAVVLALLVAVLAVRALGQTDLNPVSGVGKLSQVRALPGSSPWLSAPPSFACRCLELQCVLGSAAPRSSGKRSCHAVLLVPGVSTVQRLRLAVFCTLWCASCWRVPPAPRR